MVAHIISLLGVQMCNLIFFLPLKFKLILPNLDKELASGLQVKAAIQYRPDKNEDTFDQLLILVGKKTMKIPLIGYVAFIFHADLLSTLEIQIRVKVIFCIFLANRACCLYSFLTAEIKGHIFSKLWCLKQLKSVCWYFLLR